MRPEFTIEKMNAVFSDLFRKQQNRDFVIYTGEAGYKMFEEALKKDYQTHKNMNQNNNGTLTTTGVVSYGPAIRLQWSNDFNFGEFNASAATNVSTILLNSTPNPKAKKEFIEYILKRVTEKLKKSYDVSRIPQK